MTIDEISIPQATSSAFKLFCKRTGESFSLNDDLLIGRELDCTVRLQDPQIRRYHAKISKSEDGLFLEDLNSKNNTFLNGCRIGTGAWITLGDEINLDGVRFSIDPASSTPTPESKTSRPNTSKPISTYKAPEMPFSNQDIVEATRALEERAKARLQLFKESEESGLNPDWENFIAKRNTAANAGTQPPKSVTPPAKTLKPSSAAPETPVIKTASITAPQTPAPIHVDAANDEATLDMEPASPIKRTAKTTTPSNSGSGPRLVIQTAPVRGKTYQLAPTDAKKTWTIGRANNADIQLTEESIDLIHAHVEATNAGYKIRTTRTTNGMLINGLFKSEAMLKQGDIVLFGRMEFQYRDDVPSVIAATPTSKKPIIYSSIVGALIVLTALLLALINPPI